MGHDYGCTMHLVGGIWGLFMTSACNDIYTASQAVFNSNALLQ